LNDAQSKENEKLPHCHLYWLVISSNIKFGV